MMVSLDDSDTSKKALEVSGLWFCVTSSFLHGNAAAAVCLLLLLFACCCCCAADTSKPAVEVPGLLFGCFSFIRECCHRGLLAAAALRTLGAGCKPVCALAYAAAEPLAWYGAVRLWCHPRATLRPWRLCCSTPHVYPSPSAPAVGGDQRCGP